MLAAAEHAQVIRADRIGCIARLNLLRQTRALRIKHLAGKRVGKHKDFRAKNDAQGIAALPGYAARQINDQLAVFFAHFRRIHGDERIAHFQLLKYRTAARANAQRVKATLAHVIELGADIIREVGHLTQRDLSQTALGIRLIGAGNFADHLPR